MEPNEKEVPIEGTVLQTSDYGLFHTIESNRNVNKRHVQLLINSFENNPALVKTRPILVNEKMEVIDGQHRLQACMALRIPVCYMMATGTDVESAQLMNALQKNWSSIDFARSYALNRNNADRAAKYRTFLSLFEEYKVPITVLITFCEQRQRQNNTRDFRHGDLEIIDEAVTRKWLNMAEELSELVSPEVIAHNRYIFLSTLTKLFRHPNYDHERMIKKMNEKRLAHEPDRQGYLHAMENIYNAHIPVEGDRIRFF